MRLHTLTSIALIAGCTYGSDGKSSSDTGNGGASTGLPPGIAAGTPSGNTAGGGTSSGIATGNANVLCSSLGLGAVHDNVHHDTIQGAVDASSNGGTTVFVCPGDYDESLDVGHSLRIQALDGQPVTLTGDATQPVIDISAGAVELAGLTLTNGGGSYGGGVNGLGADILLIEDCVITGNAGNWGAGVMVGADAALVRTQLSLNHSVEYGGGLAVDEGGVVTLEDVTIEGNTAGFGGGIFAWPTSSLTDLGNLSVTSNQANTGGGVYLWASDLSGGTIDGNAANTSGGGVVVYEGGTIGQTAITNNDADFGGGLNAEVGLLMLEDVLITGNTAQMQGGGAHFDELAVIATNLTIEGNTSTDLGGGAFVRDVDWTGGIIRDNAGDNGGGIYLSSTSLADALDSLQVTGNTATTTGGGISNNSSALVAMNLTVEGNESGNRGGGFYSANDSLVSISDSTIWLNTAVSYGGGLYLNDGAIGTLTDTTIEHNVSERAGGVYLNLGGTLTMTNGSVLGNGDPYTIFGGGIRIEDTCSATLTNVDLGAGPDDNQPEDVYCRVSGVSYTGYGAGTTATCDTNACSPLP